MKISTLKYSVILLSILMPSITRADEILMAFSHDIPPYIFEKQNNGIEIDVIAAALAYKGHTLKPLYFPLGRIPFAFTKKLVNAAMGDMGVDLKSQSGFYADPAVIYNNVFITLKSKAISIEKPSDLNQLTVVSFQGAERRYPKWLKKVKAENRFYGISDQLTQVKLLSFGRYDVVLSDRYIFNYFVKQMKLKNEIKVPEFVEHKFTTSNPKDYRPVFRDKNIRDDFNMGLKILKETGDIKKIYDKYMKL